MSPRNKKNINISKAIQSSNAGGIQGFGQYPHPYNVSFFKNPMQYIHDHVHFLNNNKFFAGICMIMLNIGSKFISVQFSKSTEEYLKLSITRQILIFTMAWMGSRDIYTAFALTAIFIVLSDHLFNEESDFCIVPHEHRVLHKFVDTNNDGIISNEEISNAIAVLEKAKKEKQMQSQKDSMNNIK